MLKTSICGELLYMSKRKILIGAGPDFKMTQGRLELFHTVIIKVYFDQKLHRSDCVYDKSLRQMVLTLKEKTSALRWVVGQAANWHLGTQLVAEIQSHPWSMSLRYDRIESLDHFQQIVIKQAIQEYFH